MRYWISALLLASAASVPVYAQDAPPQGNHDGGGHEGGHGDGNHGGNGGGNHQRGGPPPQAMQPRPQAPQAQARPAPQDRPTQQPNAANHGNRGPGGRDGEKFDGNRVRPPQGNFAPGMGQRPNIGQFGDQRGNGQRPDDGRGYSQRSNNGVRVWQGGDRGRPDDGRDARYDNNVGYQGRPGGAYQGRLGNDGRKGGNWNRGWRDDHRYNWQGWRQAHRDVFHGGYYRPPHSSWGYRRFDLGIAIDPLFFGQQYWINDPWSYRLPPANGPYRWVRYYNDALLIDLEDGVVVDEIPNFFW